VTIRVRYYKGLIASIHQASKTFSSNEESHLSAATKDTKLKFISDCFLCVKFYLHGYAAMIIISVVGCSITISAAKSA